MGQDRYKVKARDIRPKRLDPKYWAMSFEEIGLTFDPPLSKQRVAIIFNGAIAKLKRRFGANLDIADLLAQDSVDVETGEGEKILP